MPLLLLVTKWFVNFPSWRRTACLALIYAAVSLASFPPFLVAGFGFSVVYLICAALTNAGGSRLLLLRRYVTAVVLSATCVAACYLPTLLTIAYTDYATQWYRSAGLEVMPLTAIFELFSPVIAATEARVYTNPVLKLSVLGHFYYVGVTVLVLAFMAGGRKAVAQARTLVVCCVSGIILILFKMFGIPPVQWIVFLPILQSVHYSIYFGTVIALAFCLLAAIGLQRLQERKASALMLALTLAIMTIGFLVLWHKATTSGGLQKDGAWRWVADYRLLLAFSGGALCLVMATTTRAVVVSSAFARGLLALIAVEGIINATYPRQNRWDVFAHPPQYVAVMQRLQKPARGFVGGALTANLGSAFGIDEFDSLYMFSAPRMYALYERYAAPSSPITMRDATAIPPEPVLDKAAINYLLIRHEIPSLFNVAASRGYATAYDDGYVCLFRRNAVAPRYLFSSDYLVTGSFKALDLIASSPLKQILLETPPGFETTPNQADDPEPHVISANLNSLALALHAPRAGLLYIADAWYPGWHATVNDKPATILIANYGFRAVVIPAGEVLVKLRYLPVGFLPGVALSAIGLIAVVVLLLFGDRDLRRGAKASLDHLGAT
jgi:hypothetical protein